jgi:hypothetical protein
MKLPLAAMGLLAIVSNVSCRDSGSKAISHKEDYQQAYMSAHN